MEVWKCGSLGVRKCEVWSVTCEVFGARCAV